MVLLYNLQHHNGLFISYELIYTIEKFLVMYLSRNHDSKVHFCRHWNASELTISEIYIILGISFLSGSLSRCSREVDFLVPRFIFLNLLWTNGAEGAPCIE